MASFLQAHPAFQGMGVGVGKGKAEEGGVMGEINRWKTEAPIQPLREMFKREEREQELIRAAGEDFVRNYGKGEGEVQPGIEQIYRC